MWKSYKLYNMYSCDINFECLKCGPFVPICCNKAICTPDWQCVVIISCYLIHVSLFLKSCDPTLPHFLCYIWLKFWWCSIFPPTIKYAVNTYIWNLPTPPFRGKNLFPNESKCRSWPMRLLKYHWLFQKYADIFRRNRGMVDKCAFVRLRLCVSGCGCKYCDIR